VLYRAVKKVLKAWAIVVGIRAYSQRKVGQKAPIPLPHDSVPRRVLRGLGFRRHDESTVYPDETPPTIEPVGGSPLDPTGHVTSRPGSPSGPAAGPPGSVVSHTGIAAGGTGTAPTASSPPEG